MTVLLCNVQLGYAFHLLVSFLFVSCLTKVLVLNICMFCFVKFKSAFFLTFCSVRQQYHTESVYHLQRTSTVYMNLQCTSTVCMSLQCTTALCMTLQCTTALCIVLQLTATVCISLQCTATTCIVLQCTATVLLRSVQQHFYFVVYSNICTLQCTATFLLFSVQ